MSGAAVPRGRIAAGVAAAVAVAIAGTLGALALERSRSTRARAEAIRTALGARASASIADLSERLERVLAAADPDDPGGTRRLARAAAVDLIDVIDPDGTVRFSLHWPERAGTRAGVETSWPAGAPLATEVDVPLGTRLVLAIKRTTHDGSARVGGVFLDREVPRTLARLAGSVAVLAPDGRVASTAGTPSDGPGWIRARMPFPSAGSGPAATLALAERLPAVGSGLGAIPAAALALAALAALGVGVALASRALRPVERFVRAIDAAASGDADFAFLEREDDTFGPLAAATSRLRRDLDLERERLRATERVAAWRETARRLAHELKNPLAPIQLTMENLVKARDRDPELFDRLFREGSRAVLEEVERLRRVVSEFSDYARLPEPHPRPADVEDVLDGVLALHDATPGVTVERRRADRLPVVAVDRDLVGLAFRNLVANAVEAMPDGGRVTVETSCDERFVVVRFLDDGPGFPAATERVFEPYFTTKPGGSGLGMAIVERIVTEHGGLVAARNRPDGGAEVTVRLPRREVHGTEETPCRPS